MRRLQDLGLKGKRVLVRVDFNVPMDDVGNITSDKRIREALPTIQAIEAAGGRPILMSHLGRPKGQVVERYRLAPVARRLEELLQQPVRYVTECVGPKAAAVARDLADGECLLLENLRFDPRETAGDPEFAAALAALGDVYVNDAFGTAHRAHASVSGVAEHLPRAPGLLMERELAAFQRLLSAPQRPFVAVLGGAKVSDKLPVIENLLSKIDVLIIGGAMAYTFLQQAGVPIGKSLCETDLLAKAGEVRAAAQANDVRLLLPVDHVCADHVAADARGSVHGPGVAEGLMGLDIGPQSIELFCAAIATAATIVWNGPMGVFELEAFRRGTDAVARAIADADAWSLVGGGDSVAAVEQAGVADRINHVSTGGGAGLELLEGKTLPGIAALERP